MYGMFIIVAVIGENTRGCIAFSSVLPYYLPNSKCLVQLARVEEGMQPVTGDGFDPEEGLLPDYWVSSKEQLRDTLLKMGVSSNLPIF